MENRAIWIFWDQGYEHAPALVRQCIDSWRHFNPDYVINVLDQTSLFEFIKFPAEIDPLRADIPVQKIAALSRLILLQKYGGVWVDATVHCCKPLKDWLPEYTARGLFCFRDPGIDRMISNWLIASAADDIILQALHREFTSLFSNNFFSNLESVFGKEVLASLAPILNDSVENTVLWHSRIVTKGLKVYPYFIFHYTFNKVILENQACKEQWESSKAFSAKIPHALQKIKASTEEAKLARAVEHINSQTSPVYKLNWRYDSDSFYWGGVLRCLANIAPANAR